MKEKKKMNFNVNVRLTEEAYNMVKTYAEARNVSISDYARNCMLKNGYEGIHPLQSNKLYRDMEEVKLTLIRTFMIMQKCSDRFPATKPYLQEIEKEYIRIWDM